MPGIAGIIGTTACKEHRAALDAMVKRMMHEPFYTSGRYVNERLALWMGWVSHPESFSDGMPVWNENGDICLIFSGEDYSDRPEVDRLRAKGHELNPENAGYLIHAYEEIGCRFLEKLNGSFSGMVVDLREPKIVLFNDRYGLNRIYYHHNELGFYFSSEAKSLLNVLPNLRRLDFSALGEFFSCGCVLQNRTLFSGISLIPGGSAWIFSPGQQLKKKTYFNPERWEQQPPLSSGEYYDKLSETWARVLPRYLRRNEQVALSLTGGVDSRMILAWAPRPAGTFPCYTFGGMYRDCIDVRIARQVAEICRQPFQVIPLGRPFLSEFPTLAEKTVYITDGAMDVSGSADLFVNRTAREISPIRLTGNYGGEVLRRIVAFKPVCLGERLFAPDFSAYVRAAAVTYADEMEGDRLSFVAFKQVPWHHYSRLSLERSQLTVRSPYLDNDLVAVVYQAPPELALSNEISLRLIVDGNQALKGIKTDRGLGYRSIPGLPQARHLVQQFTFKAEYAYDYGMPQWLARLDHLFAPLHLERFFLGRHKFHHFRVWYRDELSHYLKDILLDSRTLNRPYFRGVRLKEMVDNHIKGNGNYTREIHRVLTSELIQRQLIEQK